MSHTRFIVHFPFHCTFLASFLFFSFADFVFSIPFFLSFAMLCCACRFFPLADCVSLRVFSQQQKRSTTTMTWCIPFGWFHDVISCFCFTLGISLVAIYYIKWIKWNRICHWMSMFDIRKHETSKRERKATTRKKWGVTIIVIVHVCFYLGGGAVYNESDVNSGLQTYVQQHHWKTNSFGLTDSIFYKGKKCTKKERCLCWYHSCREEGGCRVFPFTRTPLVRSFRALVLWTSCAATRRILLGTRSNRSLWTSAKCVQHTRAYHWIRKTRARTKKSGMDYLKRVNF